MRPTFTLALPTLALCSSCMLDAEIGSDRLRTDLASFGLETCAEECEGPGALLWTATVPLERPAVLAHESGELVLVGSSASRNGEVHDEALQLVRLTADGAPVAAVDLGINSGLTIELAQMPGGDVAIAADTHLASHISVVALDGTVRWSHPLEEDGIDFNREVSIVSDPSQGSIYAGTTIERSDGSAEPWIGKLDADGALLWSRTAAPSVLPASTDAETYNGVSAVALDADGQLVACGQGTGPDHASMSWIAKFDADTGDELWSETFSGNAPNDLVVSEPDHYVIPSFRQLMELEPAAGASWMVEHPEWSYEGVQASDSGILAAVTYDVRNTQPDVMRYHGIDASDGSVLWTRDISGAELLGPHSPAWSSIDVDDDDRMIAVFGEFVSDARVMAFNLD